MSEEGVIFPQLSGLNLPSHLLQVWLTLRDLGVPETNLRLIPEFGHFALPEVTDSDPDDDPDDDASEPASLRHPRGPLYDGSTNRVIVQRVDDPSRLRPRLTVNVRSEVLLRPSIDGDEESEGEERIEHQIVGRLAHFVEPMLAGLPDTPEDAAGDPGEKPLARLTRQVAARYPELMATIPMKVRDALRELAQELESALAETENEGTRRSFVRAALRALTRPKRDTAAQADFLVACRDAFLQMAGKLPALEGARRDADPHAQTENGLMNDAARLTLALARFQGWADTLFLPEAGERLGETERFLAELEEEERSDQRVLFHRLHLALDDETPRERARIIRHLLEILTTEAFSAVAAIDHLWGIGWIHGSMRDFGLSAQPPGPAGSTGRRRSAHPGARAETLLLSVTGGFSSRTLLLALVGGWVENGEFLGVGRPDTRLFSAGERAELWSLVTWRRETGDPLVLLEIAVRRLVHPDIAVRWTSAVEAAGLYGTLWAQLGSTAVLGGKARLFYPGVEIRIPLAEDADEAARAVEAKLRLLIRLFLPITLRVELVWREPLARLGQGAYLRHPFQTGIRLAASEP